jgi:uncharacterized membrane protein YkoI
MRWSAAGSFKGLVNNVSRRAILKKKALFLWLVLVWMSLPLCTALAESDPPTNKIPLSKARAIALRKAPGKVKDFEFEIKNHKWVYFFKIAGKDQKWHFIAVDAVTGKVLSKSAAPMPVESKVPIASSPTPGITPSK